MADVILRDVDRGWAWVALIASAANMMIVEWFFTCVGIFQVEFLDHFEGSNGYIALIGSLAISGPMLLGPVGGMMTKLLGPRVTIMVGATVMSVGYVSASFAQDSVWLLVLFGILAGSGASFFYGPSTIVVNDYFHKHRVMANGFTLSAVGVGILTAPYLLRWLINDYGWRLAMAGLGFCTAQAVVLASLFFPHQPSSKPPQPPQPTLCHPAKTDNPVVPAEENTIAAAQPLPMLEPRDVSRLINSKVKNVAGSRTTLEVTVSEFGSMMLSSSMMLPGGEETPPSLRDKVRHVLGRRLLWMMFLNQLLLNAGISINLVLLPVYARDKGVTLQQLPALFTVAGATTLACRLTGGLVFSRVPPRHLLKPFFCAHALLALDLGFLPLYGTSLPTLCVHSFLFATAYGLILLLLTPILVHYLGLESLPLSVGAILFFGGIAGVVCPALGGFLRDVSGSYDLAYYLAGGTVCASTLSLLLLLLIKDLEPDKDSDAQEDTLIPSANQSQGIGSLPDGECQLANEKLRTNGDQSDVKDKLIPSANQSQGSGSLPDGEYKLANERLRGDDENDDVKDKLIPSANQIQGSGSLPDSECQLANEKLRGNDEQNAGQVNKFERANEILRSNDDTNSDGDSILERVDKKLRYNSNNSNGIQINSVKPTKEKVCNSEAEIYSVLLIDSGSCSQKVTNSCDT